MKYLFRSIVLPAVAVGAGLVLASPAFAGKIDELADLARRLSKLSGSREFQMADESLEEIIRKHNLNPESPTFPEDLRRALRDERGFNYTDIRPAADQPATGLGAGPRLGIPGGAVREAARLANDLNRDDAEAAEGNADPGGMAKVMAVAAVGITLLALLYRGRVLGRVWRGRSCNS